MGRFLLADPTAGVLKLPQPFRMIDKILSGIVDDASDRGMARDLRRLELVHDGAAWLDAPVG